MDLVFAVIKYAFIGFFGLIGLFIVVAIVFCDKIVTKWEYEAEFRDDKGKEFGEFEIEMSRIEKKEPQFALKAKFRMRHQALQLHAMVQVYLDQLLVLEGMGSKAGRVRLTNEHLQNEITEAEAGQQCRIVCGGSELFSQELVPD